jgi:hypothetical protein
MIAMSCPRCGRRRQPPCDAPTPKDQQLAAIALDELEQQRCRIGLVPAPDPHFVGHKIRVVEGVTPRWYRVLWDRRNYNVPKHWSSRRKKGQGAYHSIRGYVTRALKMIVAGCIRTQHRAMDREILEVLHEWDEREGR